MYVMPGKQRVALLWEKRSGLEFKKRNFLFVQFFFCFSIINSVIDTVFLGSFDVVGRRQGSKLKFSLGKSYC